MGLALAVNGSPRMEKGNTAMVLSPFLEGMKDAGSDVDLVYTSKLDITPCACGNMYCWYKKPGECCFKDDMETVYPKLTEAETIILATPVYVPLPGAMQEFLNRLCPLLNPLIETREGRTRISFREGIKIRRMALVSTGGWWEVGNFDTVVRIAEELSATSNVEFAGAVLRPHAFLMRPGGKVSDDGEAVLKAARQAGYELVTEGVMSKKTLEAVSRPLTSEDQLRRVFNQMV